MSEIEEAEIWLKDLKLGVTAKVPMIEPGMSLVFAKEEKRWRLLIEYKLDDDEEGSLAPLANAKPEYQREGLSLVPAMINSLVVVAEQTIAEMTQVVTEMRPFIDGLLAIGKKMSDKPFINNDQALELINKMLDDDSYAGKINDNAMDAFEDMRSLEKPLSVKQLAWVQSVALALHLVEEPVKNEWSSRTLQERERIRGKEVPMPEVLQHRPMLPPHRLHELKKKEAKP